MTEASASRSAVETLLNPRSIAVVGASPTHPLRRQLLANLVRLNSPAEVMAVNPSYDSVLGFPCFPSLAELPRVPDVVVAAVGRASAVTVVEQAAAIGAKATIVFAVGFAEGDAHGQALQAGIVRAARASEMIVLGPNCSGLVNFWSPVALYLSAVSPYAPGPVALVSQSGSVTTALMNNQAGVRWGCVVSAGNEAVIGAADLLARWVDDPHISVICAFLEVLSDPEAFFRECDRAHAAGKHVIVLKSGRTERARSAAVAHSGRLSPPHRLVLELFRRHHVLRADCVEELLALALGAQTTRLRGRKVATLADSGGQIGLALDAAAAARIEHPDFSHTTASLLQATLPPFLHVRNPLDFWGIEDPAKGLARILQIVAADPDLDAVVTLITGTAQYPSRYTGENSSLEVVASVAEGSDKVFAAISCISGDPPAGLVERMLSRNVLLLSGIGTAFKALSALSSCAASEPDHRSSPELDNGRIRERLSSFDGTALAGGTVLSLLGDIGIEVPAGAVTTDEGAAVDAAAGIGFPVVVKIADAAVLHKTDVGGVFLSLESSDAVRSAFRSLRERGTENVLVQRQISHGVEMIVGLHTHSALGTFLLLGLGGIWTEVLDDVAIRPVGLRKGEAREMLQELRGAPVLCGLRGNVSVDLEALVDVIEKIDRFGTEFGEVVQSMDINPLIVGAEGIFAVDGLLILRDSVGGSDGESPGQSASRPSSAIGGFLDTWLDKI